jgi:glycine cleavage system H protein
VHYLETSKMPYPASYRYTKEHEWIDAKGAVGTIGITDYAQNSLGDIVFVDLPNVGATIKAGQVFGSVESVKAVSDLYAPVSGTVTEVNTALTTAPEQVNTDAHSAWMLKVKLSNPAEVDALLDAAAYEKYVAEETGH